MGTVCKEHRVAISIPVTRDSPGIGSLLRRHDQCFFPLSVGGGGGVCASSEIVCVCDLCMMVERVGRDGAAAAGGRDDHAASLRALSLGRQNRCSAV
eukprot:1063261-Amorphochlora_amoeboformis.AAC.1